MQTLNIIAAFIIAILSGMGIGSGGLFTIWLTAVAGTTQLAAQGLNLLFFLFSGGSSMSVNKGKRKIYWKAILILTVSGIVGTLAGSFVAGLLPVGAIRTIFGATLMISGIASLFSGKKRRDPKESPQIK